MNGAMVLVLLSVASLSLAAGVTIEGKPGESLESLRDRARHERTSATQPSTQPSTHPVTIRLAGGTIATTQPLVLESQDSYTTWEAATGATTPVISGGRRIAGWHEAKLNGGDCWAAEVPAVRDGTWYFRELWVDGRRAIRARRPDAGHYFHVVESPDAGKKWDTGQSRMRFDGDDVPPGPYADRAEAIVMSRWVESRLPIRGVEPKARLVEFFRTSQWRMEKGDPYWLEGDGRFLDKSGEWFLDRAAGTIYYLPRSGEKLDAVEAIAPVATTLIELRGDPANPKKFIENVVFRGITFAHTQWMLPEPDRSTTQPSGNGGFAQAAVPVPAAVTGTGLRNVTFEDCGFRNLGTWGLELGHASQLCRVERCSFSDLGAGGIKLGDESIHQGAGQQTFANRITGCEIKDCGNIFPSAVGIWVGQAFDNVIARNHIHDLFYSGISVGWSWGYGDSLNRGNIVERNHVHHIGRKSDGDGPILSDMGCVYLLGARSGTVVRNNHFHDAAGVKYGGWCIYLDEGSSDVLVENNLAHHATHGLFHLHYGRDNVIRNNIFAFGGEEQIVRTKQEDHSSFTFERNLLYWTRGPMTKATPANVTFRRNAYAGVKQDDFRAGELTWDKWREAGQDADSSCTPDVAFSAPDKGDFRLKDESLAQRIGFVPFEWPH